MACQACNVAPWQLRAWQVALGMMRRSVRKRAGFDLDEVAPLDSVGQCHVPALFGGPC